MVFVLSRFESFAEIVCIESSKGPYNTLRLMAQDLLSDCIIVTGNINLNLNLYDIADVYRRKECACLLVLEQLKNHKTEKDKVCLRFFPNLKATPVYGITSDHRVISYADLLLCSRHFNIPHALLAELEFGLQLMRSFPSFTLYTNLRDCECYFMSKTMLKLLDTVPTIDDLRVGSVGLYKIDRLLICYDSSSALLQVAFRLRKNAGYHSF